MSALAFSPHTNPGSIKTAIEKKSCDTLLLKVNQIGSITEAIDAALLAKVLLDIMLSSLLPSPTVAAVWSCLV